MSKKPLAGNPSILIIDDDTHDREQLAQICINAGYTVEMARTGREATDKYQQRTFDLITLDLILPDIDGWDILRSIRAEEHNRNTPIIVITVVKEKGIGVGFAIQEVLAKPIQTIEVQAALNTLLAQLNSPHGSNLVNTKEEAQK
jgi:CheY-like chemotaxis protein